MVCALLILAVRALQVLMCAITPELYMMQWLAARKAILATRTVELVIPMTALCSIMMVLIYAATVLKIMSMLKLAVHAAIMLLFWLMLPLALVYCAVTVNYMTVVHKYLPVLRRILMLLLVHALAMKVYIVSGLHGLLLSLMDVLALRVHRVALDFALKARAGLRALLGMMVIDAQLMLMRTLLLPAVYAHVTTLLLTRAIKTKLLDTALPIILIAMSRTRGCLLRCLRVIVMSIRLSLPMEYARTLLELLIRVL
jgi:hypothetical protein